MCKEKFISDERLIELVGDGNLKAMEELFNRYYKQFALKLLKDKDTSKDIVSDIFFNIWEKKNSFIISSSVRAYLYISVRNRAINFLKANKKLYDIEQNKDLKNLIEVSDFAADIENEEVVEKILSKLPEKKKLVFRLKVIDELKYKEIAEILSISVNTVQNHMVQAFKILSKEVNI
ncbi:MAG: sigma-70 family RNA polymerase sigma factor [Ignavibacteria bacterium]|jgi:RNA polymerase sigma-70 factor (ECF subfamily)